MLLNSVILVIVLLFDIKLYWEEYIKDDINIL